MRQKFSPFALFCLRLVLFPQVQSTFPKQRITNICVLPLCLLFYTGKFTGKCMLCVAIRPKLRQPQRVSSYFMPIRRIRDSQKRVNSYFMPHPTQSDIARKLKVSRITVSKALRGHPDISTEMKKRVLDAASDLGYIPNLIAQNLTAQRTYTLGVVIPDLENSFFAYATDSIIDAATEETTMCL